FTFEKSPGNLAGCVKVFTVVDCKREEIQSFSWLFCRARGHQHYGISVADQCGAMGLFCQLSDFDREFPVSDHRADFVNVRVFNSSSMANIDQKRNDPRSDAPGSFCVVSIFFSVMPRPLAASIFGCRALKSLHDSVRRYTF